MKVKVVTHPTGEQIPIILDYDGLPIPAPNEYLLSRRDKSTNTLVRNARELSILYKWLYREQIDLRKKLTDPVSFNSAQINSVLVEQLRQNREQSKAVSPITFNQRLTTVRQFINWYMSVLISQLPYSSNKFKSLSERKNVFNEWLSSSFISAPPSRKHLKKGLSKEESNFLMNILDPTSIHSFGINEAVKYRNFISVGLMIYCGLRPGELLSLRVEDITIGGISSVSIVRRKPDLGDIRKPRPQVKRNGRLLPIENPELAKCLNEYIVDLREVLEDKSELESDYLILSDEGEPLSQASITQFFHLLRNKYSQDLPENLSAKSLRHTFSSRMEIAMREAGLSEQRRREALAHLRGDSSLSSQDVYIAQAVEESAKEALRKYQCSLVKENN
ncbi:tyrosine-type recombinase/integrase [Psychrobacter okhotskensis]|uniref:tyrosine-type recombinase/integrase n=1 Tax=Psychrobacter okhotskensis TaxID=212403 RepID=UPI00191B3B80|nr:site-specific integrase [Psychrobacter okhotskensis]